MRGIEVSFEIKKNFQTWTASPTMADFGDNTYLKKFILQLNIKRSKSAYMDFVICLYNLGERESENQKDLCAIVGFCK